MKHDKCHVFVLSICLSLQSNIKANDMNIQDTITRAKIQKRVSELVKTNMDDEGNVSFDVINAEIVKEFGDEATEIAKEQFNFMMFQ